MATTPPPGPQPEPHPPGSQPAPHAPGPQPTSEPDPRFLLANERTYLAWIRTSLALLAAAAAVTAVDLPMSTAVQRVMAVALGVTALVGGLASWRSWRRRDLALRRDDPLPEPRGADLVMAGLLFVGLVLIVAVLA